MIDSDRILFIPSLREGNGTGHLKRCLDWASDFPNVHIYILRKEGESLLDYENLPLVQGREGIHWHCEPEGAWKLIVLDNRETTGLPDAFKDIPVVAIDETGPLASDATCLVNTLPMPVNHEINKEGYNFINRPLFGSTPEQIRRVLVSFGGEDPAGLADSVHRALLQDELKPLIETLDIDIILPGHPAAEAEPGNGSGLRVLGYVPRLSEKLTEYDLIITQFGLTAFEALSCSRYVMIFNPTGYHDKLTLNAELPLLASAGEGRKLVSSLKSLLESDPSVFDESQKKIRSRYATENESFALWLRSMNITPDCCPVCGKVKRKVIARFEDKSYFTCSSCGMKYMVNLRAKEEIYTKDYFFSEYREQYGKTYIEDFPHIRAMAAQRLAVIDRLNSSKGRLLDIGCAYGPFLLSAFEAGYKAEGLEISEDAVEYIRNNFPEITALRGDLTDPDVRERMANEKFRVITLWYVIEHFSNLQEILPLLHDMLDEKGVLAMATPCASGVSGLFRKKGFFSASPADHFTLWDRKSAVRILKKTGFRKIRFRSTGHHPERFPESVRKIFPRSVLLLISRAAGWGDTFEIYSVKG